MPTPILFCRWAILLICFHALIKRYETPIYDALLVWACLISFSLWLNVFSLLGVHICSQPYKNSVGSALFWRALKVHVWAKNWSGTNFLICFHVWFGKMTPMLWKEIDFDLHSEPVQLIFRCFFILFYFIVRSVTKRLTWFGQISKLPATQTQNLLTKSI